MAQRKQIADWRERARELRNVAQMVKDDYTRRMLVQIADTWEDLATKAEKNLETA